MFVFVPQFPRGTCNDIPQNARILQGPGWWALV